MISRPVAVVLVAVGVLLRLATLGRQSLWHDEAFGVWAASAHDAQTIWIGRLDPNEPALFYLILHYLFALVGVSEAAARLPAALTSIVGIGLAWGLGRTLWPGTAAGRFAGVLLALAPIDFWFAQEGRMHGMVGAAGLAFALGLWIDRPWAVLLLVAGLAGGLMLDHTMWPVSSAVFGVWLVHWWQSGRSTAALGRVLAGLVAAVLLYAPVWPEAVDLYSRLDTVSSIANLRSATGLPTVVIVPLPVVLVLFLAGTIIGAAWWHRVPTRIATQTLLAVFLLGTAAMAVPRVYGLKQVIVCAWPLLTVLVARAVVSTRRPALPLLWSGLVLVVTLTHSRADWRGVTHYLRTTWPDAVVVLDPTHNKTPYRFYRPGAPVIEGPVRSGQQLRPAGAEPLPICLVAQRFGRRPPTSESEAWMDTHLTLASETPFSRLAVRCYHAP